LTRKNIVQRAAEGALNIGDGKRSVGNLFLLSSTTYNHCVKIDTEGNKVKADGGKGETVGVLVQHLWFTISILARAAASAKARG